MSLDGSYAVDFQGHHGLGTGVVHIESGRIRGGDSGFSYFGEIRDVGAEIAHGQISIAKHSNYPGMSSVTGADRFQLNITVKKTADSMLLQGEVSGVGVVLRGALRKFTPC